MKATLTVLRKTIVQAFYRQNAGLLLLLLFVAGSFMRAAEHIALATYAIHAPAMLLGYIGLWGLYTVHASRFMVQVFRANEFLLLLRLQPVTGRLGSLWVIQVLLLTPVIAYAGFVLTLSLLAHTRIATGMIVGSLLLLTTTPLVWVEYTLLHPNPDRRLSSLRIILLGRFTTPYSLFFIRHLFHRQPVLLLLTKGGSCLLLVGLLWLYPTDEYDIRLPALGALLTGAFHAAIIYELYRFELTQLLLVRNLPVSLSTRFVRYAIILALMLLPELVVLLRNNPVDIDLSAIVGVWVFAHSLLMLHYGLLLTRHRSLDRFMPLVFWLVIGGFFLIMYKLPIWGLAGICDTGAAMYFLRCYYQASWSAL
ncbi:hypothetical protein GCM10023187_50340 [Nibrella viscosa]|uniref:Uncharacterized protein n=1 Tax=Nibrella viscosa TaxID=1084524 RepID=A0ABP8KXR9_9BACT